MNKIITSFAALAFAASALAADFSYTVDPAEGEVTMLQFVTLTFPNVDEIAVNSTDDITVTRADGSNVRGVEVSVENDNELAFVFGAEQTDPGTYTITIPADALAGYADNYAWMEDNPEDIVLTYTIAGGQQSGFDWSAEVDPAEGTLDRLEAIKVTFPGIEEIEFLSKEDITLSFNGQPVEKVKVAMPYSMNYFNVTLLEAATTAGEYTLSVPASCIVGYDAEYNEEYLPENLEFTWTIEGVASEVDFDYTSSLPTDEYLAFFGELTLTFGSLDSVSCEEGGVSVTFNGEALDATVATDGNKLNITLKENLNFVEGTVAVTIAAEALTGNAAGTVGTNPAPISIDYNMASPVEYNLELAISSPIPNAEGQISAERSLESIFFVCEEKGLVTAEGSDVEVTIKEDNGSFNAKGKLRSTRGLNANYSYFSVAFGKEPTYNGKYTITIPKGAFGTAAWAKDPNYGRSNAELELSFELIDGADHATFTIEPVKVNPVAGIYAEGKDIASITLTFDEGVEMVEGASATLAGVESSYAETAEFEATEDGFTVTFANAPAEEGKYMLTVVQGMFGDEDFVDNGTGKGSAPISIEYSIDFNVGVAIVAAEKENVVYNLQGVRVNAAADRLPAGIYVIDGKKVVVKK